MIGHLPWHRVDREDRLEKTYEAIVQRDSLIVRLRVIRHDVFWPDKQWRGMAFIEGVAQEFAVTDWQPTCEMAQQEIIAAASARLWLLVQDIKKNLGKGIS